MHSRRSTQHKRGGELATLRAALSEERGVAARRTKQLAVAHEQLTRAQGTTAQLSNEQAVMRSPEQAHVRALLSPDSQPPRSRIDANVSPMKLLHALDQHGDCSAIGVPADEDARSEQDMQWKAAARSAAQRVLGSAYLRYARRTTADAQIEHYTPRAAPPPPASRQAEKAARMAAASATRAAAPAVAAAARAAQSAQQQAAREAEEKAARAAEEKVRRAAALSALSTPRQASPAAERSKAPPASAPAAQRSARTSAHVSRAIAGNSKASRFAKAEVRARAARSRGKVTG